MRFFAPRFCAALAGLAVLAALAALAPRAAAAPVEVRAPTRLHVGLERVGAEVIVSGTLLDELNQPIPGVKVLVLLTEAGRSEPGDGKLAPTDAGGRFEARFDAFPGVAAYMVRVNFTGSDDGLLLPISEASVHDAARKRPVLEISGPTTFPTTGRGVPYEVRVTRPVLGELPVTLAVVTHGTEHAARTEKTNAEGLAVFVVKPGEIEAGGPATLIARSPDSEELGLEAAEARLELRAVVDTRLTLDAARAGASGETVELGDRVALAGALSELGADGAAPLAGATVTLFAEGPGAREEEIGTAETDGAGRFRVELDSGRYDHAGALAVRATYTPNVAWRAAAASPVLQIRLSAPEPLPVLLYLLPLAVALGAVGVIVIRGGRRRAREKSAAATGPGETAEVEAGVLAAVGAGGTAGAAGRHAPLLARVSGTVVDAVERRGIEGATIELAGGSAAGTSIVAASDATGAFETPELPEGTQELRVRARGYVSETFQVRIPHRGEHAAMRVALAPVRQRVLEAFRRAAIAHLPKRALLFVWTARELGRHVRRAHPHADRPMGELGRLFDRVYFSSDVAEEAEAARAAVLAEQARGGAAAAATAPPPAPAAPGAPPAPAA